MRRISKLGSLGIVEGESLRLIASGMLREKTRRGLRKSADLTLKVNIHNLRKRNVLEIMDASGGIALALTLSAVAVALTTIVPFLDTDAGFR